MLQSLIRSSARLFNASTDSCCDSDSCDRWIGLVGKTVDKDDLLTDSDLEEEVMVHKRGQEGRER